MPPCSGIYLHITWDVNVLPDAAMYSCMHVHTASQPAHRKFVCKHDYIAIPTRISTRPRVCRTLTGPRVCRQPSGLRLCCLWSARVLPERAAGACDNYLTDAASVAHSARGASQDAAVHNPLPQTANGPAAGQHDHPTAAPVSLADCATHTPMMACQGRARRSQRCPA